MSRRSPGRPPTAAAWLEADRRLQAATSPEPAVAPAARPARRGDDYFCRRCGATAAGPEPPAGWYRAQQRDPAQRYSSRVFQTLGLYCSVGCLAADTAEWATAAKRATG